MRQGNAAPGENAQITIGVSLLFKKVQDHCMLLMVLLLRIQILSQEIESIEVLKDGASASIYGSRASGG